MTLSWWDKLEDWMVCSTSLFTTTIPLRHIIYTDMTKKLLAIKRQDNGQNEGQYSYKESIAE